MSGHNPSRKTCEEEIRRVLMKETLENGHNIHFKNAMDFMRYFEALYPSSPALVKQVQRAIKSMDLPKDEKGYYIIDKTKHQLAQDAEITHLLHKSDASMGSLADCETVFLSVAPDYKSYLIQLLGESSTLSGKYVTIVDSSEGLIFYTRTRASLETMLNYLIKGNTSD